MTCPVLLDPACIVGKAIGSVAGAAAGAAANDALSGIAGAIQSGVAWITANSVSWWVKVPSPNLAGEPAVTQLQQWMLPVAAIVAVFGVIVAGGKMALTRKANPLIDTGSGLVTIAVTSAVGVLLPTLLLQAGDAWSNWVLNASTGGQFGARLTDLLAMTGISAPAVVVILGIVAIIISALQAILMLFRQGALVVLAGTLPLAAAGTLTPATRPWFKKITGWMLALIFYKPAAAAVYAAAFTMIGTGKDLRTILTGFAMVLMSLLALPVLMKFFTWTTGQVADASSGGGFMQAALSGAVAVGALRGASGGLGGAGAADQARQQSQRLGPADGGPSGAQAPAAGVRPAATAGTNAPPPGTGTPAGAATPGTAAGAGATSRASSGDAATAAGARGAGAAGAGSTTAGASAAPGGAAAAGGPAGLAASGLAAGARSASRKATEAMQPPEGQGGQ
jgi:hypothetical protein